MKQDILNILIELDKWRAERKLTTDSQQAGYIRNIMEELGELASAIKVEQNYKTMGTDCFMHPKAFVPAPTQKDFPIRAVQLDRELLLKHYGTEAYIDALCDIMVFTGNLIESKVFDEKLLEKEIKEISTQVKYYLIPSVQTPLSLLLEYPAMVSQKFLDTPGARATLVAEIFFTCKYLANQKGYSFSKSMNEVLKQINSRQGSWNEELKKWVKDTSDEAREKEYQANFNLAKLTDKGE